MRLTFSRSQRVHRAGDREEGLAGAGRADADRDVVREDAVDVLDLVRRAAVQVRPARQELGFAFVLPGKSLPRDFGQAELHVVDGQFVRGEFVEMLDRLRGARRLLAAYGKARAAARDLDIQRGFDLAQVFVQRAAQPRQAPVVDGVEPDFDGLSPHAGPARRPVRRAASGAAPR